MLLKCRRSQKTDCVRYWAPPAVSCSKTRVTYSSPRSRSPTTLPSGVRRPLSLKARRRYKINGGGSFLVGNKAFLRRVALRSPYNRTSASALQNLTTKNAAITKTRAGKQLQRKTVCEQYSAEIMPPQDQGAAAAKWSRGERTKSNIRLNEEDTNASWSGNQKGFRVVACMKIFISQNIPKQKMYLHDFTQSIGPTTSEHGKCCVRQCNDQGAEAGDRWGNEDGGSVGTTTDNIG